MGATLIQGYTEEPGFLFLAVSSFLSKRAELASDFLDADIRQIIAKR